MKVHRKIRADPGVVCLVDEIDADPIDVSEDRVVLGAGYHELTLSKAEVDSIYRVTYGIDWTPPKSTENAGMPTVIERCSCCNRQKPYGCAEKFCPYQERQAEQYWEREEDGVTVVGPRS